MLSLKGINRKFVKFHRSVLTLHKPQNKKRISEELFSSFTILRYFAKKICSSHMYVHVWLFTWLFLSSNKYSGVVWDFFVQKFPFLHPLLLVLLKSQSTISNWLNKRRRNVYTVEHLGFSPWKSPQFLCISIF